ncbi:MAG TPA: hypothetical protein DCZ97_05895 [Syntrophus sp. (in: bacteria)]|nr:MAG: hypothetical protein A2X92_07035 [Syntrophus sp. GWC2_56_31]HBB16547.1 hypothetical protein [Syntrophus sp. (in: bacteria)]
MKRWIFHFISACCLIGTAGCSHLVSYLEIAREKGMSGEYLAVLNEWTRSQVIYSQFETQAHLSATYQSPEFNRAYLDEYARIYQLQEKERKKQEDVRMTAEFTEFIFYASLPEKTSNDFDRRGSIWTIFLVNGKGERIDPWEVRRIDPVTPVITKFFPYVNPYHGMVYRLRFHPVRKTEATSLKLVITGVLGTAELKFVKR